MVPDGSRDDVAALIAARTPIVVLETADEAAALDLVVRSALRVAGGGGGRPVLRWSVTDGLRRLDVDLGGAQRHNTDASTVLRTIVESAVPAVYILLDLHPWFEDPVVVRLLKDAAQAPHANRSTVVLVSRSVELPHELEHLAVHVPVAFPSVAERAAIVDDTIAQFAATSGRSRTSTPRPGTCWSDGSLGCPAATSRGSRAGRSSTTARSPCATCPWSSGRGSTRSRPTACCPTSTRRSGRATWSGSTA
ncbi:hypothetical protein ACFP82_17420 [Cellulomonas gelida]|uniref:hypothetical protein n=1 Tax=Cellulomonas gelida TaxID=1712 RepID=UPI00360B059D